MKPSVPVTTPVVVLVLVIVAVPGIGALLADVVMLTETAVVDVLPVAVADNNGVNIANKVRAVLVAVAGAATAVATALDVVGVTALAGDGANAVADAESMLMAPVGVGLTASFAAWTDTPLAAAGRRTTGLILKVVDGLAVELVGACGTEAALTD